MKVKYIKKTYENHLWKKDGDFEDSIDHWAVSWGYCNGPVCERCGDSFCEHCNPECWDSPCEVEGYICKCDNIVYEWQKFCPHCGEKLEFEE